MIQASNIAPKNGIDNLQNETDKLLSDKYILAKDIRDLIRTIKDSKTLLNSLYNGIKNKLKLIDQLEMYIQQVNEKQNESGFSTTMTSAINELMEQFNSGSDLEKLPETLKPDESDIIRGKQLLTDNILILNHDIKGLLEQTESINLADADAAVELNHMKGLLKQIEEEITGHKYKEQPVII